MAAVLTDNGSHWVFGYGSLIWRPGFAHCSAHQALLFGAHRRLCIYSHRYRGTPERPGLVFGLVRGGSCRGMAFEVTPKDWLEVRAYLQEREQVTGVYLEALRPVKLADGRTVRALTFLVDEGHDQYAGDLDRAAELALVKSAHGAMGPNVDYVTNTSEHLREMGIVDRRLEALNALLKE